MVFDKCSVPMTQAETRIRAFEELVRIKVAVSEQRSLWINSRAHILTHSEAV